ncbi:MAG: hypothetical protein Fur0022_17720 [Anaerolineales bacterium]
MSERTSERTENLARNASWMTFFVLVLTVLAGIYTTILYLAGDSDFSSLSITWLVAVIAGVSFGLSRKGKNSLGVSLFLGMIWLVIGTSPFRHQGNGLLLGVFVVLFTIAVAPQTMMPKPALRMIMIAGFVGILTILMDWYWPVARPPAPVSTFMVISILGSISILVSGYFLLREIRWFSLRTKLTIGFLIVAIGSTSVVGFMTNLIGRATLSQQLGKNITTLTSSAALQIGNLLNAQLEILHVAAEQFNDTAHAANAQYTGDAVSIQNQLLRLDQEWQEASDQALLIQDVVYHIAADEMREIQASIPAHVEIFLTDRYGAVIAATARTSDYYQADETWWQIAYNNGAGGYFISTPIFDDSTQTFAIQMAVPVYAEGNLVGILRSTFDISALGEILEGVELGTTGQAELRVAQDLFWGLEELENKEAVTINSQTQAEFAQVAGTFGQIEFEGRNVFASQVPIGLRDASEPHTRTITELGWTLIIHQDTQEAFAPIETLTRTTVLTTFLLIVLTGGGAIYLSNQLSNPIVQLTQTAEEVRKGNFVVQAEQTSQDEIGILAATFNQMTAQVRALISSLEQQVANRTQALRTSTEVSRRLSTILNQDELIREVVNQIQKAFNYYHVHIYLWDAKRENLLMMGGTGEAGRLMLASGHFIPAERGLVGRAAETGTVVLVPNVSQTIGWLANPLLPETKAEIAVPIILGEEVLGVLDVQHNVVGGLDQNDADLLQSIASQVAIGLQNAQAYQQAQKRAQKEAKRAEIIQKIQSTSTVEDALQVAVREISHAVAQEMFIRLESPSQNGQ